MSEYKVNKNLTVNFSNIEKVPAQELTEKFTNFLDIAGTATNRASYYNTKKEQQDATIAVHDAIFNLDRGLYSTLLLLNGTTDYNRQIGLANLLKSPVNGDTLLPEEYERKIIDYMTNELNAPRLLRTFIGFKELKINNARTRKLILKSILAESNLPLWSVKYRTKVRNVLQHAWGVKTASIVNAILKKNPNDWNDKEKNIINKNVNRYIPEGIAPVKVYDSIRFAFGDENNLSLDVHKAYIEAKGDIEAGKILPPEVLEGIRSTYHKDLPKEKVLEITKEVMTKTQKMTVQRKAKEAGVKIDMNPMDYDIVRLYIYAFEMGMTDEIMEALNKKAKEIAKKLPFSFDNISIILDNSDSMKGDASQKNRPISIALALRDVFEAMAKESITRYSNLNPTDCVKESKVTNECILISPTGATDYARELVEAVQDDPDAIFIITDGYENSPSGRVAEVMDRLKGLGVTIPIYQINPVMSAEASGVRNLSEHIPTLPVNNPKAIGLGMIKAMIGNDVKQAIKGLLSMTVPLLAEPKK